MHSRSRIKKATFWDINLINILIYLLCCESSIHTSVDSELSVIRLFKVNSKAKVRTKDFRLCIPFRLWKLKIKKARTPYPFAFTSYPCYPKGVRGDRLRRKHLYPFTPSPSATHVPRTPFTIGLPEVIHPFGVKGYRCVAKGEKVIAYGNRR